MGHAGNSKKTRREWDRLSPPPLIAPTRDSGNYIAVLFVFPVYHYVLAHGDLAQGMGAKLSAWSFRI